LIFNVKYQNNKKKYKSFPILSAELLCDRGIHKEPCETHHDRNEIKEKCNTAFVGKHQKKKY
jgi:hypothetical protein